MSLNVWNGSSWIVSYQPKIWNGSAWADAKGSKVWNGSTWKEFLNLAITNGGFGTMNSPKPGEASYSLYMYGYSSTGGTYIDYDGFFNVLYDSFGVADGKIRDFSPVECYHSIFSTDAGVYEATLKISVTGNLTGTYTPYVDGVAVAGPKLGIFSGGVTTFRWRTGTRNDGDFIGDNDTTTPVTSPFANTVECNVQLL
jgi:hypothetical protein